MKTFALSFPGRHRSEAVFLIRLLPSALFLLMFGCATPEKPFASGAASMPSALYCFDTVGHKAGAKPFILGGTCCCTPTAQLVSKYHADGILTEMNLQDLLALYEKRGIKTKLDHVGCNNLCEWGPHLIKGGHCMVPPTPATPNFEEVRFGVKYIRRGKLVKD